VVRRARGSAAGLLEGRDLHGNVCSLGGWSFWSGLSGVSGELVDGQLDQDGVGTAGEVELRNGLGLDGRDQPNDKTGAEEEHGSEEGAMDGERDNERLIEASRAFGCRPHGDLANERDGRVKRLSHRSADDC